MFKLENIQTGEQLDSPVLPVHTHGIWDCRDFRVTDPGANEWHVVEVPETVPRHITVLAFRNRFKAAEKVAIEIASLDNPTAPMPERQQAAALRAFVKDSETATFIDLDYEATREGVQYLEIAGVLQEGRAAEILDAEILDSER